MGSIPCGCTSCDFTYQKKVFKTEYLYIKLALDFMNYNYTLLFRFFHRWAARLLQLILYKKKKIHYISQKKRQKKKKSMFLKNITIKLKVLHTWQIRTGFRQ
jgi:hypothetical protein